MLNLEKQVDKELKKLDPDLYLDKLRDPLLGYSYYAVRYFIGSGTEPFTSVEWKDEHGPIDLSLNIVEFVKRNESDVREDIAKVTANNAAKKEIARQEALNQAEEIAREFAIREKTDYWRSLPAEIRRKSKLKNR